VLVRIKFVKEYAGCGNLKKTNRESARIRPTGEMNRICLSSLSQSSFAVLLVPSSGPFGQILSPPQRLPNFIIQIFLMCDFFMSRWGSDRICPNVPDEGQVRVRRSLTRVKIRADSRFYFSQGVRSRPIPFSNDGREIFFITGISPHMSRMSDDLLG